MELQIFNRKGILLYQNGKPNGSTNNLLTLAGLLRDRKNPLRKVLTKNETIYIETTTHLLVFLKTEQVRYKSLFFKNLVEVVGFTLPVEVVKNISEDSVFLENLKDNVDLFCENYSIGFDYSFFIQKVVDFKKAPKEQLLSYTSVLDKTFSHCLKSLSKAKIKDNVFFILVFLGDLILDILFTRSSKMIKGSLIRYVQLKNQQLCKSTEHSSVILPVVLEDFNPNQFSNLFLIKNYENGVSFAYFYLNSTDSFQIVSKVHQFLERTLLANNTKPTFDFVEELQSAKILIEIKVGVQLADIFIINPDTNCFVNSMPGCKETLKEVFGLVSKFVYKGNTKTMVKRIVDGKAFVLLKHNNYYFCLVYLGEKYVYNKDIREGVEEISKKYLF